ncbi:unnamed protein product [Nezara viridula]|uniref:Uncharacterized protein n=1 Tax=Nezara viridula TaxID=85310 RepID=A0A9P0MNP4_NEZVI|nr:unnamed protein product [Nezara viridula]
MIVCMADMPSSRMAAQIHHVNVWFVDDYSSPEPPLYRVRSHNFWREIKSCDLVPKVTRYLDHHDALASEETSQAFRHMTPMAHVELENALIYKYGHSYGRPRVGEREEGLMSGGEMWLRAAPASG